MKEFSGFEWDDSKRRANIVKHGLDFADAVEVFEDPKQFTNRSPHPIEERFVSVGMARGRLIAVVFTRHADKVRIISARSARRIEREQYGD
jgi:uncharacterized protein